LHTRSWFSSNSGCQRRLVEDYFDKLFAGTKEAGWETGNALIGCRFDRFQDYPAMAWDRDGGDSGHDRFVHHFREYVVAAETTTGKGARSKSVPDVRCGQRDTTFCSAFCLPEVSLLESIRVLTHGLVPGGALARSWTKT